METKVITICNDTRYDLFKKGQIGFIDGYIRGGDDRPYAIVVVDKKIDMVPLYNLRILD